MDKKAYQKLQIKANSENLKSHKQDKWQWCLQFDKTIHHMTEIIVNSKGVDHSDKDQFKLLVRLDYGVI